MPKQKKDKDSQFILVGVIVIAVLIFAIIVIIVSAGSPNGEKSKNNQQLSLEDNIKGQQVNTSGKFKDETCDVSFSYPNYWRKSDIKLPLPQEPLSQVTFDEPASQDSGPKNSIFSFICYDAQEYSVEEFIGQNPFSPEEAMNVGSLKWKRNGNFVYLVKNGKLLIFQMFFTKNDIKPITGYEDLYVNIIKSAQIK